MRDPFLAGILSLIIPGVGQIYNGRILAGILWLILTPGFWIGMMLYLGAGFGVAWALKSFEAAKSILDKLEVMIDTLKAMQGVDRVRAALQKNSARP